MRKELEKMAVRSLELSAEPQGYTDRDLMHASVIFNHVVGDMLFAQVKDLGTDEMVRRGRLMGRSTHSLIKRILGKDMKLIARLVK